MRVLISGVTSDLGRAFARAALGAGHDLVGVGAEPHRDLPRDVAFTAGDAATAESLVAGSDVVVHLAPVEREVPESGGIPGLRRMATAAARHGIRFVAPIAHGPDAADADRVVRDSGTRHVVVRTAPIGGRLLDWQACRTVATMLTAPRDTQWRLLHTDDLVRFLLYAITSERTGAVTLAAQDIVVAGEAREMLRGVAARGIPRWPDMSTSDRKGSARDWGFECGWTSAEVVADLARGARARRLTKDGAVDIVNRLPIPAEPLPRRRAPEDGTSLASVALPSMAVELDDRIDPRYPVFSVHQTAELFPEPLTPLSIDVHTAGLRAAGRTLARLAGLPGPVADEWESRGHAVFGHHLYAGVSSAAAAPLPGWTEESVVEAHAGPRADLDLFPLDPPAVPTGIRGLPKRIARWSRFMGVARRYRATVRDFAAAATNERLGDDFATLPDAVLAVRARLVHDRLAEGWTLTQLGVLVAHLAGGPLRKRAKGDLATLSRGVDVADESTFTAIAELAARLRADEELRALAEWGDLEAVRQKSPEFGTAFDEVLTRIGHRGLNETELAGLPFSERPDLVFMAALATSRRPDPEPPTPPAQPNPTATTAEPPPASTERTPPSADSTLRSAEPTLRSVEPTSATAERAPASTQPTSAPAERTPASAEPTPTPLERTPAPFEPTTASFKRTPTPFKRTAGPFDSSRSPLDSSRTPFDSSPAPSDSSRGPFDSSPAQSASGRAPFEPSATPFDPSRAPFEQSPASTEPSPGPDEASRGLGGTDRGLGGTDRGLGGAGRGLGGTDRGLGGAGRGLGEGSQGFGELSQRLGEGSRGPGEGSRGSGEGSRGFGEPNQRLGEPRRGLGEASGGLGEASWGLADPAAGPVEPTPAPIEPTSVSTEPASTSDESPVDDPAETNAAPPRTKRKLVEKLAIAGRRQRGLAVDATIRYTGELRRLVREWGRRQVHAGRLVDVDDAFFLTLDELLAPPADVLTRVERRRADLERLARVRMPAVISGSWRAEPAVDPMPEGKQLHGVGVSAGVVEGPVRVLTDARADIELGDVVVVRAADVGHAALLGPAAAVVTDLGGPLSSVAVVARELGVPCVTSTRDASARLAPGTIVRVDGTTGDVTVLTPASMRV